MGLTISGNREKSSVIFSGDNYGTACHRIAGLFPYFPMINQ